MPSWPDTLPAAPLIENYAEAAPDNTLRTAMDQGPAKMRLRGSSAVRPLAVHYLLSKAQVAALETFYLDTLFGGTAPFDYPHPRTSETVSCRFVSPPQYAPTNGDYFKVALALEVLP